MSLKRPNHTFGEARPSKRQTTSTATPDEGKQVVRALQAACRSRPPDVKKAREAAISVSKVAASLAPNDLASGLQALAKLPGDGPEDAAVAAVREQLSKASVVEELDAVGVAITLWALPRLQETASKRAVTTAPAADVGDGGGGSSSSSARLDSNVGDLMGLLERRLADLAPQCNTQDLANSLWSFAKLRWTPRASTWKLLQDRLYDALGRMKAQELSIALWSMATLELDISKPLKESIEWAVYEGVRWFQAQSVANSLWALGRMQNSDNYSISFDPSIVQALAKQATETKDYFTPQGLANALTGLVQLSQLSPTTQAIKALLQAVQPEQLTSTDIGAIALSLGHAKTDVGWQLLLRRAHALVQTGELDWQALGRIDFAAQYLPAIPKEVRKTFKKRVADVVAEVNASREVSNEAAESLLLSCRGGPVEAELEPSNARVLLVDVRGSALVDALRERRGCRISRWRRFASGPDDPHVGISPKEKLYDAAVFRLPSTQAGLELALAAATPLLKAAAPVWLFGTHTEGILSAKTILKTHSFSNVKLLCSRGQNGVVAAIRSEEELDAFDLKQHSTRTKLEVEGQRLKWLVFPGLFAGGVLDIMTKLLLETIQMQPPPKAKILDFCSGSGTIAAAMSLRAEEPRLHLLDADAVALEAARSNVPAAKRFWLSDRWASLPDTERFDWILSNPPVHLGLQHDFSVLSALLHDAPARLKPGGRAVFVVQTYVPVGYMSPKGHPEVTRLWSDERFTVWQMICD